MKEMTVEELKQRIESGQEPAILDIREAAMFSDWHIPGAFNLPVIQAMRMNDFQPLVERAGEVPRGEPVVVVCNRGISARKAVSALTPLGFDAINLIGGMAAWSGVWSEANIGLAGHPGAAFVQVRRNGKGCLSYVIADAGEAIVVDPCVAVDVYMDIARRLGARIVKVLETHVHADHISRGRELCAVSDPGAGVGAELMLPRTGRVTFECAFVDDGDCVEVGGVRLRAIHTPGHTGESTCYLVNEEALLTGDTVFTDSVGRPDLEKGDAGAVEGAHMLYKSLHGPLAKVGDEVMVYPAHTGAGIAFDGVPVGATLGEARRAMTLLALDEATFVQRIVEGLSAKPPSHEVIIAINEGKTDLGEADPLEIEAGPNRCAVATKGAVV